MNDLTNETHHTAFDFMEDCNGNLGRYNDRKICGMLDVKETEESLVTSNLE
jgi:hypothetical protein